MSSIYIHAITYTHMLSDMICQPIPSPEISAFRLRLWQRFPALSQLLPFLTAPPMKVGRIGHWQHWTMKSIQILSAPRSGGNHLWSSIVIHDNLQIIYKSTNHLWSSSIVIIYRSSSTNSHIFSVPQMMHPGIIYQVPSASCRAVLCACWASFTSAAWAVCQRSLHPSNPWESERILI